MKSKQHIAVIVGMQLVTAAPLASGGAQSGADSVDVRLTRELTTRRARLPPLELTKQGDRLAQSSIESLKRVARVMATMPGSFIIEAHVKPTSNATADQASADRHASIVRGALIELGVPAARLFAVGVGRDRRSAASDVDYIDIARLR